MEQEFEIKLSDEFKFLAELQLVLHEYAEDVKPGVKPEWFKDPVLGLAVTNHAKAALSLEVQVNEGLVRQVLIHRGGAVRDDPPKVYISFYQNHNRMRSSHSKWFEKDQNIMESRTMKVTGENETQLCMALVEYIFQFLFTAEVPDVLTY